MTKRNRFYQIGFIVSAIACIGLMLAMGIIALQKNMTLKMGLEVTPTFECKIVYDGTTIFCNTTKNSESFVWDDDITIGANSLTLNQNFSGLGAEFTLTIYNYTPLPTGVEVSSTGASGEPEQLIFDAYTSGTAPSGNLTITATGTSATLTFGLPYILTYNSNGGSGEMDSIVFVEGVSKALTTNSFAISKGTYNSAGIFLGWSEDPNATKATYTDEQSITISKDTILYAVWDYVWTIKAYNQTNVTTGYNSNFDGYYYVEMGEYPQTYKSDDTIKVYSTEAKTTDITTSTTTSGTIGYGSDGERYYFQNRMPYYNDSGATTTYYTDYISGWYKFEPIRWIIIGAGSDMSETYGTGATLKTSTAYPNGEVGTNQLLLISELTLYATQFDRTHYTDSTTRNNRYYTGDASTTSDVYYSINTGFDTTVNTSYYRDAPDAAHMRKGKHFAVLSGLDDYYGTYINQTTIAKTTYYGNTNATDNTSHYIFLLGGVSGDSYYISNYLDDGNGHDMDSDIMRLAYSSDFAKATSVNKDGSTGASYWWLRSGFLSNAYRAYYVQSQGNIGNINAVYLSHYGARPCFILNLA